jgi:ribonuclease P protein component
VKLFSLGKAERIKSHAIFNELFLKGRSVHGQLIKVIYTITDYNEKYPVKAAFVVPKRNIRNAYMRNRIRRLMKESYRKNKKVLYDRTGQLKKGIQVAFVFNGTSAISYAETEEKIIVILHRLIQEPDLVG